MLKLYHYSLSAGSRFVRLVTSEMGARIQLVEEQVWHRRPEFLSINPAGHVPVLIDNDGPAIMGSIPIMEYLDETRGFALGDRRLMPDNPIARAEVRRLVDWMMGKFENEVTSYLVHEKFIKREIAAGSPDARVLRAARSNVRHHVNYVGYLAETRDWLAGRYITYADLAAAAAFSVCDYLGEVSWDQDDHCRNWYARMKSRPSFRPLLSEILRGLPPSSTYSDLDF